MGDIGEPRRKINLEPFPEQVPVEPVIEPVHAPSAPTPEREPVPA